VFFSSLGRAEGDGFRSRRLHQASAHRRLSAWTSRARDRSDLRTGQARWRGKYWKSRRPAQSSSKTAPSIKRTITRNRVLPSCQSSFELPTSDILFGSGRRMCVRRCMHMKAWSSGGLRREQSVEELDRSSEAVVAVAR
jgi:hypothetical protein